VFNRSPYRDKKVVSVFVRFRCAASAPKSTVDETIAPKLEVIVWPDDTVWLPGTDVSKL
jgi:hypothetical protein